MIPDLNGFVNNDLVLKADFIRDEDATHPDYIFFEPYDRWVSIESDGSTIYYLPVPETVQDTRISWVISDPEVAELMEDSGEVYIAPKNIGDAVITGIMKSGLQESFVLHVYDPEEYPSESLTAAVPLETELKLYVGESAQM